MNGAMNEDDRRLCRSDDQHLALAYQLDACCEDGVHAMVVADGDGVPLAWSGDLFACNEVAGRLVRVGQKIQDFHGTVLGDGESWPVHMTRLDVDGAEIILCVVGGDAESQERQMRRGVAGVRRILGPAPGRAASPP
jgi:hypothetical protein